MKKVTQKEELAIYRRLLINLHTARWTGNDMLFEKLLKKIGDYSYARTNTNAGNCKQEEKECIRTLLELDK